VGPAGLEPATRPL